MEAWEAIVESAVRDAGQGDRYAREWLASYLMNQPEGAATTLHMLAVDELVGVDTEEQDASLAALSSWP